MSCWARTLVMGKNGQLCRIAPVVPQGVTLTRRKGHVDVLVAWSIYLSIGVTFASVHRISGRSTLRLVMYVKEGTSTNRAWRIARANLLCPRCKERYETMAV
jgi:hypothetical protein